MKQGNDTSGCYFTPESKGQGIYYNKETGKGKCYIKSKSDFRVCIKQPWEGKFKITNSGMPDKSVQ